MSSDVTVAACPTSSFGRSYFPTVKLTYSAPYSSTTIPVPTEVSAPSVAERRSDSALITSVSPDAMESRAERSVASLLLSAGVKTSPAVRLTSVTMPSVAATQPVRKDSTRLLKES